MAFRISETTMIDHATQLQLEGRRGNYASFVVDRQASPLPGCDREVGVDVGLGRLVVTSDGEVVANPRFLRAKERHLARARRALSRKRKGSANRARARHRGAA
jgi:putative transposase